MGNSTDSFPLNKTKNLKKSFGTNFAKASKVGFFKGSFISLRPSRLIAIFIEKFDRMHSKNGGFRHRHSTPLR